MTVTTKLCNNTDSINAIFILSNKKNCPFGATGRRDETSSPNKAQLMRGKYKKNRHCEPRLG